MGVRCNFSKFSYTKIPYLMDSHQAYFPSLEQIPNPKSPAPFFSQKPISNPPKFFARVRVVQLLLHSPFSFHFFLHIHSFYVFSCICILNLQSSFILYSLLLFQLFNTFELIPLLFTIMSFTFLALYIYVIYFPCYSLFKSFTFLVF